MAQYYFSKEVITEVKMFVTKKQYGLVKRALENMKQLYEINFLPLFEDIAKWYGCEPQAATHAAKIISELPIVAPNHIQKEKAEKLGKAWKERVTEVQEEKHQYSVELTEEELLHLSGILDAFSRITMGQLKILFETLDMPAEMAKNPHMEQMYHDVYWNGSNGATEARDLLFPGIRAFGWHGGYGISNREVAEDSRLAYQISKSMRGEYALPVTDEPSVQIRV